MKRLFQIAFFTAVFVTFYLLVSGQAPAAADSVPPVITAADTIPVFPNPVDGTGKVSIDWLINAENGLYAGLLFVLSFLSFAIPGVKNISEKIVRTLAIGATLIVLFIAYKAASGDGFQFGALIQYVVTYILTTGFYDKVIKPAGIKTPQGVTPPPPAS